MAKKEEPDETGWSANRHIELGKKGVDTLAASERTGAVKGAPI